MNGDLSRNTFDQLKHYSRVVMQQGRVQLDADWNEQVAILLHYLQTLAADLIGQHGGPADLTNVDEMIIRRNLGFEIITRESQLGRVIDANERDHWVGKLRQITPKILISKGRYYVDGRLCEIENYLPYSDQPGYPWLNEQGGDENFSSLPAGSYLVYLDVWERGVTSLEDPEIREVALGGADTAARSKLLCQVKIRTPRLVDGTDMTCDGFPWDDHLKQLNPQNRGKLRAKAKEDAEPGQDEPCITAPDARYRGAENHLYRVEIHKGGIAGTATFKWSRENGSIVAPVLKKQSDKVLIVGGFRDSVRWFTANQWVELTHEAIELNGRPGTMVWVTNVDGETLTIDGKKIYGEIFDPGEKIPGKDTPKFKHVKARAWNHKVIGENTLPEDAVMITESADYNEGWIDLEDGVQIQFAKVTQTPGQAQKPEHVYRTGDYWLITARVATGDVEWPTEEVSGKTQQKDVSPHGVEHHYAPLAIITLSTDNVVTVDADLRHKIPAQGVC